WSIPTTWTSRRRGSLAFFNSQIPAAWARLSMSRTPGITGAPGKWPSKNSSEPVTLLIATNRPPGSCSTTRSTSTNGYWVGIWRTRPAMSIAGWAEDGDSTYGCGVGVGVGLGAGAAGADAGGAAAAGRGAA